MKDSDLGPDKANPGTAHLNIAREIGKATEDMGTNTGSSSPIISNHSVLFVDEILARTAIPVPGLEEDQAQDASSSQTCEEWPLLRQTHNPGSRKQQGPSQHPRKPPHP